MMRIALFLLTNLAIVLVISIVLAVLGVGSGIEAGNQLNYVETLILAFVVGMVGSFMSLFMSKWIAKRSTGTQVITTPNTTTEQWLVSTVTELAAKAGIKTPEVGIFPSQQSNAFATGWNKNASLVAVSTGILTNMNQNELKAVLGHEIGHVANGDMVTLTLIQGVVNTFVIFLSRIIGNIVDRVVFKNEEGPGIAFYVTTIVMQIVLGIAASSIVMWFSRRREFRADEAGAKLAGKQNMIAALQNLMREQELPDQMPAEMQAMAISKGQRSGLAALFSSHPPLTDRIEALHKLQSF